MVWQFSYKCMAICISKLPIYMPNYIVYRPFFTLVLLPAEKYQCGKVPYGTFPHWYFFRKALSFNHSDGLYSYLHGPGDVYIYNVKMNKTF